MKRYRASVQPVVQRVGRPLQQPAEGAAVAGIAVIDAHGGQPAAAYGGPDQAAVGLWGTGPPDTDTTSSSLGSPRPRSKLSHLFSICSVCSQAHSFPTVFVDHMPVSHDP